MQAIFSNILMRGTQYPTHKGVISEFKVWFKFCHSHRGAVYDIVIYWTALKRHPTVEK